MYILYWITQYCDYDVHVLTSTSTCHLHSTTIHQNSDDYTSVKSKINKNRCKNL